MGPFDSEGWEVSTVAEVRRRVDPYNREITADYTRMSLDMRECLGVTGDLVDWAGFAAWVSYTLGAFLRRRRGNEVLALHPRWRRATLAQLLPRMVTAEKWLELAESNVQIHREIRAIYDLVFQFQGMSLPEALASVNEMTDELWERPPFDHIETTAEDRYWGRHAVTSFLLAAAAGDQDEKAELVYSANVALSAIEQRRADQEIDGFLFGLVDGRWWIPSAAAGGIRRFGVWLTTRWLTQFVSPWGFISVGRGLVPPPGFDGAPECPLDHLSSPWARTAAEAFWEEQSPKSTDWSLYEQRMAFIASYFREYQRADKIVEFRNLPQPILLVPRPLRPRLFEPGALDELSDRPMPRPFPA